MNFSRLGLETAGRWMRPELALGVALRASEALLLMGLACFAGGILLMFQHRREWLSTFGRQVDPRTRRFEDRKFRRRAVLASMISSAGCVMTSMYWLSDPKLWAMMMGVLLLILVGILGLAVLDLFSIGLREITEPNPEAQQEMIRKYLELREKRAREQATGGPPEVTAERDPDEK